MACFTTLTPEDVEAIARGFGLGRVVSVTPIAAGTISSNFAFDAVADPAGADPAAAGPFAPGQIQRCFVRLNEGKAATLVAAEAELARALADAGVPTPRPLRAVAGGTVVPLGPHAVSAFPWCDGRHLAATEVGPAHAHAIGAALAGFHAAGLTLPPEAQRAGIYQFSDLVRRFEGFRDHPDPALAVAIPVLAAELGWLTAQAPVRAAASHGLVHGDLFRDNVLWDGERLVAILDLEQAARGSFAYDLAVMLNDWCWLDGPSPALAAALLAGYQAVRPLTAADRAALPVEVRAAAARFTITRITDVHLRQVDNPDKDFRAFLARLVAWQGAALGALLSSV